MVETFNIDLVELFSDSTDSLLILQKPPVSRGSYKLTFNSCAINSLGLNETLEGESKETSFKVRERIALAIDEDSGQLVGFATSLGQFFATKTISISKSGVISNKRWHTIISEHYKVDWDSTDTFELSVAPYPGNTSLLFFQPHKPITDTEALNLAREELVEIEETISEASALNESRPMLAE